jgi:hypothetical protein
MTSSFLLKLRRTGVMDTRPRRIGLGFANVTVFAGSWSNKHTVKVFSCRGS